jgi:hypothetical protein
MCQNPEKCPQKRIMLRGDDACWPSLPEARPTVLHCLQPTASDGRTAEPDPAGGLVTGPGNRGFS